MDETEAERKRRLARERRAARLAARKTDEERWRDQVESHFHFLQTEYGFQIVSVDASFFWETVLIYQSSVAAVKVARSIEFDRAEVSLIRLVNGKIPPILVFFLPDSTLNQTLLENVVLMRAPEVGSRLLQLRGLTDEQLNETLAFLASATREYASDVLKGDFTAFDTVQAARREHARKHPPKITIWSPADAPEEHVAQLVDEVQKQTPEVVVEAQRYRRPRNATRSSASDSSNDSASDNHDRSG